MYCSVLYFTGNVMNNSLPPHPVNRAMVNSFRHNTAAVYLLASFLPDLVQPGLVYKPPHYKLLINSATVFLNFFETLSYLHCLSKEAK